MSLYCDDVCGGGVQKGTMLLSGLSAGFQSLPLQANWALLVLIPWWVVCVHSRTLWGLSNDLSCEARSFSCCLNPFRFIHSEVLRFYCPCWNPGLRGLSHSSVVLPSLSAHKYGTTPLCQPPPCLVCEPPPCCESSPPLLPISSTPTGMDGCFFLNFLNSLVVGLPCGSIFWQFWLFLFLDFVVLLLVVGGGTV